MCFSFVKGKWEPEGTGSLRGRTEVRLA